MSQSSTISSSSTLSADAHDMRMTLDELIVALQKIREKVKGTTKVYKVEFGGLEFITEVTYDKEHRAVVIE
jgi:hypothetical protein